MKNISMRVFILEGGIQITTFTMLYLKLLLCSPRVVKMVAVEIENYQSNVKKQTNKKEYSSTINF